MSASCVEGPEVRLEPWAKAEHGGWEKRNTGRLLSSASSLNANSGWTRAYTAHWFPEAASRIRVVYYGVPVPRAPGPAARSRKASFPWPYILCVARLAEYKGLDVLSMAFAEVLARGEDVRLVLVGADHSQGQLFPFIEKLGIADRVLWLGQQPHSRVLELMRGCLFLVLPSRRENLGGVVIEAMAAGKAVVASRTGGIPELVDHGRSGLLVGPKDPAALGRAMLRLLRDPEERERFGKAGLGKSRVFSWEKALDDYLREWTSHPEWRSGAPVGILLWDSGADQTSQAIGANLMELLRRRGQRFVLCFWRSNPREPFRQDVPGGTVVRLGRPLNGGTGPADARMIASQLLRIHREEGVCVWHVLLIRYRRLQGLLRFLASARQKPVVTLA